MINEIEPLVEPILADSVARCLDEFVLKDMSQAALYMIIAHEMRLYELQHKAWQLAKSQQRWHLGGLDKEICDLLDLTHNEKDSKETI